jgi:outer membrane receptor protein involved in Fe transport
MPLSLVSVSATAQGSVGPVNAIDTISGQIVDAKGQPIAAAAVRDSSGKLLGVADSEGKLAIACVAPCRVVVEAAGFRTRKLLWQSGAPVRLDLAAIPESVSITAYRAPLGELESPASTRVLTAENLQQAAPITLDGQMRLVAGVETFRRSSSLVANPSSQGMSLRGLGSTSASRTLVTQDDVPLNDAFGGWIHWEELPELSIRSVEVVRGGASDLYGSSAIGGVVNVLPVQTGSDFADLKSDFGSENTYDDSLLLEGHRGPWSALATGGVLGTDGFITLTPAARGAIDTPSDVHDQNGVVLLDHKEGSLRLFLRGSGMNEARDNGTIAQVNSTRLWRFATGSDWNPAGGWLDGSSVVFRAYGSNEHYYQTFSTTSIAAGCTSPVSAPQNFECLNRIARTPDDEMGLVLHWSKPLTPGLLFVVGADSHDVRAGDYETAIAKSGAISSYIDLTDRQRQTGAYAELLFTHKGWTISSSGREDWFSNFDGNQLLPSHNALPQISQRVFDPRLAISGSGFRAFRAPTPNELYRSTQVGSLLTYPNNYLLSERATGWESGIAMQQRWGTLRTSYFWTQVNRPITALTLDALSSPKTLMRENLGQIESRGVSIDLELQPTRWMTLQTGYQHTNATVTKGVDVAVSPGTPSAVPGDWIPQVAHNMATAQLRGFTPKLGTLSLQGRISGHQFDDDANTYLLHGYFKLDAYASHDFGKRIELFTSGENLFNRAIEVGRTPTLTLGTPRTARVGFNFKLGPGSK